MKRFLPVILALALLGQPSAHANPLKSSKFWYWVSVGTLAGSHVADYRTTETAIQSGAGREANPLLQQVVMNREEFAGVKVGLGGAPVAFELWQIHKSPKTRVFYTIVNFGLAGFLGSVAWHNHQISVGQ